MFRRMTRERYLSDEELSRFMRAVRERRHVHQPRDYCLFALLANTGIRPAEALALTLGHLHLRESPPWLCVRRKKKRKRVAEYADIEISPDLAAIMEQHASLAGNVAATPLFKMTTRSMQRLFKAYARIAGIDPRTHLYVLRHTAATRLYIQTRSIKAVQDLLGHEHPDTSCLYAHVPFRLLLQTVVTMPVFV